MRVSPSTVASLAQHDLLPVVNHFGDDLLCRFVDDHRTQGQTQHRGFSFTAVTILAEAVLAPLRLPVRLELEVNKVVGVVVSTQDDISSLAAIPSIRTAPWLVLFPPERDAPPPAVTGLGLYNTFIDKHGRGSWLQGDLDPFAQVSRHIKILTFEEIAVGLVKISPALDFSE